MLTTAQVVETSVIVCNSPNEYYKLIWTNIPYVLYYNLLSSLYLVLERFSWNQTFLTSQFLKWSSEEKVYLNYSFVREWRGLFEYFDMGWFFHESLNEFNKFCLKVNRTIALFGLTCKSERLSAIRFQGSPIRIWVCE